MLKNIKIKKKLMLKKYIIKKNDNEGNEKPQKITTNEENNQAINREISRSGDHISNNNKRKYK